MTAKQANDTEGEHELIRKSWCSEPVKFISPRFNGSIFVGGGSRSCSRPATMLVQPIFSNTKRPYCTYHGNRRLKEQQP